MRHLRIIFCEIVNRKYTELSIRAASYLSIINIGSIFALIKVQYQSFS